jgi:hypothetical protein
MRYWKRITALVLLILLAAALAIIWAVRARSVARYQHQLLLAGEKLKLDDVLPPLTPADQNGVAAFRQTMATWRSPGTNLLDRNPPAAMHMVAPGKAMVGWMQPDIRSDGTNTWSQVEAEVTSYQDDLQLVREAAAYPALDFNLDYRQGFTLLLPHLAPLKRSEQYLSMAVLCALHNGDVPVALTNAEAMLGLVKGTANECLGISQLVRISMANISMTATWELLQSPGLTDNQLAGIQRRWSEFQFVQPMDAAVSFERAMGQLELERMRNSSAECRRILSGFGSGGPAVFSLAFGPTVDAVLNGTVERTREARWRLFSSYPDQLRSLKGYQVLLGSFRNVEQGQPFNEVRLRQQADLAALGLESTNEEFGLFTSSAPGLDSMFSQAVVSLEGLLNRVFDAEVARQLTTTAISLKRYQLRHNQYPTALSELVPELLPSVPRDPADGQPLHYRLNPDGTFLLYSIGSDGVDDGGNPSPPSASGPGNGAVRGERPSNWTKGRDLVWPSPASPDEIASYQKTNAAKHSR